MGTGLASPVSPGRSLRSYINFTEKQQQFQDAIRSHRYVLYGGARGGGKSYALRWLLLDYLIAMYHQYGIRDIEVGLFCETYPELQDRQIKKIQKEFPPEIGTLKSTQAGGLGFYLHPFLGGGVIALRNLDKPAKYQSAEFAAVAVDELTKITLETFDILRGSLRWAGISHTLFLGATNPGGIGHGWVKQYWIDRQFPEEMKPLADQFKFIQSLPFDNQHLTEQYWQELESIRDPHLRAAWLSGNWDVFQGMAFPGFDRNRHVVSGENLFNIPEHWPVWRAIDWGYHAPYCCLWLAKDPDIGRIYVFRETYGPGRTEGQQITEIHDSTTVYETDRIKFNYADPAMWAKKTDENRVYSSEELYRKGGIRLTKADNDRLSGKRKINNLLANLADGKPGLMIFETCTNLVRTLPNLALDDTNVEDVDTDQEDHAYDALRYGLTNVKKQKPKQEHTMDQSPLATIAERSGVLG